MVSDEEIDKFVNRFLHGELNRHLRFGQAFCNEFNITDHILFNMESPGLCLMHIWKHYARDN
jgi:hypothetical protein